MSTILKALRRLEEDRNPLVERPLREQVARAQGDQAKAAEASPQGSGRGRIALVGALAVAIAVGAGALAFLSVGDDPPQRTANAVGERPSPSPRREAQPRPTPTREELAARKAQAARRSAPPAARPARGAIERGLPADALASEVKVIDRPMPEPRLSDPDAPAEVAAAPTQPDGVEPGRVARSQPYSEPVAPSVAAPAEEMATAEPRRRTGTSPARRSSAAEPEPQPVAQAEVVEVAEAPRAAAIPKPEKAEPSVAKPAEPESANTAAPEAKAPAPKPAPIVHALAPSVRVEQTRWHPDPTRRTAVLEVDGGPREVQEGDSLGPLVVTKIEPSGVIFTKDGVELRRRVGE